MQKTSFWLEVFEPGHPYRQEIYRFRYSVYVVENGKRTDAINHNDQSLIDPIDDDTHLIVCRSSDGLLGTISLRFGAHRSKLFDQLYIGYFDSLDPSRIAYVSRLMVSAAVPNRHLIADSLIETAFWCSVDKCMYIGLIHGAKPMIRYFQRWGFRPYGTPFNAQFSDTQFPMAIAPANAPYFHEIDSPLISSGRSFPNDSGELALFNNITFNQSPQKVASYE